MLEVWKDVPGYWNGYYQVSNRCQVRSLHKNSYHHILSQNYREGYPSVIVSKNGKWKHERVHRLMALAFIENPKQKPWVILKDGNRKNICLDNLAWATPAEVWRFKKSAELWKDIISQIRNSYESSSNLINPLIENYSLSAIPC